MTVDDAEGISIPSVFVSEWAGKRILSKYNHFQQVYLEIDNKFLVDRISLTVLKSMVWLKK